MIYLVLAILSSAAISILMRLSEKYISHNIGMLVINYLVCSIMAVFYTEQTQWISPADAMTVAVGLGIISGILYLVTFVMMQWNIQKNGVVLPATFMKLGVAVPTLLSILLFREAPTGAQVLGFAGTALAILMIHRDNGSAKAISRFGLLLLLLLSGITDFTAKLFEEFGTAELENHYLLITFLVATALCFALMLRKKQRIGVGECLFGLFIGIPNYFSAKFLLLALGRIPAVAVYPTYSVGTIVVISCAGMLLFHERMSKTRTMALAIILVSLTLLNL